ncbi:Zn(II)-responsive transcriptional regulator/Cu(I)-responsive transcriptional regulator,TIGR02044 [Thiohalorhabdus denitrificans]|uniref:Zn(II)-responsive transcriptional regulator/Cu(I)-responsive transcriptional regulator,TIGR02044 n=2 Tax=Thiohalorhabdus denitrificans TaxID=381306 RepID=A0A1G5C0L1_9GAMM|nr:heavy metal-responsive transcriptional regulator [Thiohalorhabdus denitrificans]SCX95918.1 Zn(II)-responsive transcriptional regulator/Cu(I)-responsive transcriptional regulator,TIGR02044 [Thiohalorhabdus denitrificans]
MSTMTIGQLAGELGLATETLRYYERRGLVTPSGRSGSGYRLYGEDARERLRFIRRAQALGFSLDEVAELLAMSDNPHADAGEVKALTDQRIADIEARIRDLEHLRDGLQALFEQCPGHGSTADCPILGALNRDDE